MNHLTHAIVTGVTLTLFGSCSSPPETPSPEPPSAPPIESATPEKPAAPTPGTAAINEIDISGLFALRETGKALIYDVRLPLYHKLGHIEGSILFYPKPFDEAFAAEKPRMNQALKDGKTIVVYCGGADCDDSHIVGKMIAERGIPVSVYSGGWAEWKQVGID